MANKWCVVLSFNDKTVPKIILGPFNGCEDAQEVSEYYNRMITDPPKRVELEPILEISEQALKEMSASKGSHEFDQLPIEFDTPITTKETVDAALQMEFDAHLAQTDALGVVLDSISKQQDEHNTRRSLDFLDAISRD